MKKLLFGTMMMAGLAAATVGPMVELPAGTKITARLEQTITSATAEEGQPVQLIVTEDIRVGDMVAIPQGSPVVGTITQALGKRRMGRTGKLDFSIDKVRAADGRYIPLRYTMQKKEGGSHAVRTGVLTASAAVVFWPAAPAFLLMKGKDVTLNRGITFDVFTDQDHKLNGAAMASGAGASAAPPSQPMPQAAPAAMAPAMMMPVAAGQPPAAQPAAVQAMANVMINSDVNGAEIEVDGAFVGSTPMTKALPAGNHKVVVRDGQRSWERILAVQAGENVNVQANLGNRRLASAAGVAR